MTTTRGPEDAPETGLRLQKLLAAAGVDSRRKSEEYVTSGRVTVDGEIVTDLGRRVDPETQDVRLDGERLRPQKKKYFLLNKPAGYICTNYDRAGRNRAVDLVPTHDARLFTVGRLDESSEGLLLVTNDGDLAQQLAHPRYQVPRVYRVQVAGIPSPESLSQLRKGLHFTDGRFGLNRTKRLKTHGRSAFLEVELTQGQNREIRRLFARIGHKVIWLQRVAFGPLKLGDLPVGRFRPLRSDEIKALNDFVRQGASRETKPRPAKKSAGRPAARPARPAEDRPAGRRILDLSGGDAPQPATPRPATPDPKPSRPAARKPAAGKPAAGKTAIRKPTIHKPTIHKPTARKPTTRKPAQGRGPSKPRKRPG